MRQHQQPLLRRVLRRVLETASKKVLGRVLRRCIAVGFRRREFLRRVSRRGPKKGLSRRCVEGRNRPFREYDPIRVRPTLPETRVARKYGTEIILLSPVRVMAPEYYSKTLFGSETNQQRKKHMNKPQDCLGFSGDFVSVFLQTFATHPITGQSPIFVYVSVFFLSKTISVM